tara:strand:+ start:1819 stop:2334 length:516 start_codon:yes stop_codon:yes gene_type:complete
MAFDIITIEPTTVDGAHAAGDVFFNLTSFQIPARACKLLSIHMEVANGAGEDDTKLGILFFKKNTQVTLGTLDATANIAHADFTSNQYIGQSFLTLSDAGGLDNDIIDTTALYYPSGSSQKAANSSENLFIPLILKGDSGSTDLFAGGVVHAGAPDFDGTANVKIHLHVEY